MCRQGQPCRARNVAHVWMAAYVLLKKNSGKFMWKLIKYALFSVLTASGCAHSPLAGSRSDALFDRAGISILASSSTRQHTYMKQRDTTERFCRGPGADSVNTASEDAEVQIPLQGISAGLAEGQTTGALGLGGRNPAVLIARELMYRACELASNINADPATERQIYIQFLQAVTAISKAQTGAGASALASEPTSPMQAPAQQPALPSSTQPAAPPDYSRLVPNK